MWRLVLSIVIILVEIRGKSDRLAIDAAKDIPIHRQEVYEAIKRTSHQAGRESSSDDR
jgi:carbon storage regulator